MAKTREDKDEAQTVAPPPQPKSRRRVQVTAAEWNKIHDACVRSEREPDPAQLPLLENA